jgi:hypothetical protein
MRRTASSLILAGGMLALATAAQAQSSPLNAPRFFDPRVRCHDAPHLSASNEAFQGRISVLPGRSCVVRQGTGAREAIQLVDVQILQPPEYGRITKPSRSSYIYRAPPGEVTDDFVVRLIYEGPEGRIFGPQIRYEVRVGR